jgi:hypothetical protein
MAFDYSKHKGDGNPNYKTGFAIHGKRPSFYHSWQNMKARCSNPKHPKYYRYGGRGVSVCEEWDTIQGFSAWALASGWQEGLSIDRINNDGNYCPENCHWVTQSENSRKKSTTKISFDDAQIIRQRALNGESEYDLAKEYGVVHGTVWFIVKNFTHVADGECTKKLKENNLTPAPQGHLTE